MSESAIRTGSTRENTTLVDYRQELDLRRGLLLRTVRFEDASGRRTLLQEQRLVSMADMHLGALEVTITAENWSGRDHRPVRH